MERFGYASVEDLREDQDRRLARFVREQIEPYHPHYGRVLKEAGLTGRIRSVADLRHLPFTTKADLLPRPGEPERIRDFVLQPTRELLRQHAPLRKKVQLVGDYLLGGAERALHRIEQEYLPVFLTATTGRSAKPVPFLYTLHDIEILKVAGRRLIDVLGIAHDAKTVNLFPYAPHLAFWQVTMAGLAHGVMVIGTGGGRVSSTEANIQLIERLSAECIVGVPSYVYHLLRRGARSGARFTKLKQVVLGAEKITEGLKDKIRETCAELGAPNVHVFGTFGFTEARMAFAEMPAAQSTGYHLYPDLGLFEIVDPKTGEVLPDDADGELVYTPLDGRGTIVMRFRTGDVVKGGIRYERLPQFGGVVPRLSAEISRVSNVREVNLKKVKGTLIDLNELAAVLQDAPQIEEWQVEIRKKDDDPYEVDELVLLLALKNGASLSPEFKSQLGERIQTACEIQPNDIRVLALDELVARLGLETEMKEKRIVDARPKK